MWQEPVVHTNFGDNRSPSSAFFKEKKAEFSKECIREERIGAGRKTREQKNGEKESEGEGELLATKKQVSSQREEREERE